MSLPRYWTTLGWERSFSRLISCLMAEACYNYVSDKELKEKRERKLNMREKMKNERKSNETLMNTNWEWDIIQYGTIWDNMG